MLLKRRPKIIGLEEALSELPESERASAKIKLEHALAELFENADVTSLPGREVPRLPDGAATCPVCGAKLDTVTTFTMPDGELLTLLECEQCDETYSRSVVN